MRRITFQVASAKTLCSKFKNLLRPLKSLTVESGESEAE